MKRGEVALLALIVAAGLGVRLYFFAGTYVSDDWQHAYNAYFMFRPEARAAAEVTCPEWVCYHRMGVNLPLALVITLFGPREWAMALVPLTASLAAIGLTYILLRRMQGPAAALLGALLAAFLPIDVYQATVWLQDSLFVCFLTLFLLCLVAAHESGRRRWLWAVGAGLALAYLEMLKETAFLLIGAVVLWSAHETWRARRHHTVALYVVLGFVLGQIPIGFLFLYLHGDFTEFIWWTARVFTETAAAYAPKYTYGQALKFIYKGTADYRLYGWLFFLLPLTAVLTFGSSRNRYRLVIGLLTLVQLAVLSEPLRRFSLVQTRYMMQTSVPFLLITVLGLCVLLRRVPGRLHKPVVACAAVLVALSGLLALDRRYQECDATRAEGLRRAYAYLADNAAPDEPIYTSSHGWARTRLMLYQFNGYQRFKGGFRNVERGCDAKTGWVVLSYLENPVRVGETWLEVLRAGDEHHWVRVFRILPEAPRHPLHVLRPLDEDPLYLPLPRVTGLSFARVVFDAPAERYRSHWCGDLDSVTIAATPDELRCTVAAPASPSEYVYAGVRFFTAGLRALRLTMAFQNPENIRTVYVDGYTADRRRVARWLWRARAQAQPGAEAETFILVPGESGAHFRPEGDADPDRIDEVHVFVLVPCGAAAGFTLRDVEVVPAQLSTPDLSAYTLRPVDLVETDPAAYLRPPSADVARAVIERLDNGLRAVLETGTDTASRARIGGLRVPVAGLQAAWLTVGFEQPENIEAFYLDGCDARGRRVLRWEWLFTPARQPGPAPVELALVPGQPCGHLRPVGSADADAVDELQLLLKAKIGARCGIILHAAQVAEAAPLTPDLGAYALRPVPLDATADVARRRWSAYSETTVEPHATGGLRCTVDAAGGAEPAARYGGLRVPIAGLQAARVTASFAQPENTQAIYVDGYDRQRKRVLRWEWRVTPARRPPTEPATFAFVPGKRAGSFRAVETGDGDSVVELRLFVKTEPDATCSFVLHDLEVAEPPLPQPDVSGLEFREVAFTEPAAQYLSPKWHGASQIGLALTAEGLRCDVAAAAANRQYGGVRLSAPGLGALRLEASLLQPENIVAVYVDGYSRSGRRVVRWQMPKGALARDDVAHQTWTFVPGEATGRFGCAVEAPGPPITAVDVFLQVAPAKSAGFVLHRAEVAPPAQPLPR